MPSIAEILLNRLVGRVVIVGVGNPLRGDAGAGPLVIARLEGRTSARLVDGGDVPESRAPKIVESHPDVVLVVDTADLGGASGSLELIESEHFPEASFGSGESSLISLAESLESRTPCQVFAVAIQAENTEAGAKITPAVEEACYGLVELISSYVPPVPNRQP